MNSVPAVTLDIAAQHPMVKLVTSSAYANIRSQISMLVYFEGATFEIFDLLSSNIMVKA